jgi:hypothetical protein
MDIGQRKDESERTVREWFCLAQSAKFFNNTMESERTESTGYDAGDNYYTILKGEQAKLDLAKGTMATDAPSGAVSGSTDGQ